MDLKKNNTDKEHYRRSIKSQIAKKTIWHIPNKQTTESNGVNYYNFAHSPVYFRDKRITQDILSCIMLYRKPNCYKYLKDKRLFFIQTNKKFCSILLYCALPFEVQVNRIIAFLRKKKIYYVLVPRIIKNDLKMVEFRLPLAKNYFHIKEPQSKIIERMTTIDIAVVPVLGVDKDLKRVGFGKGMYDRFYATLRVKPYSIFVSRKKNISDASLCNDYDIQADIYISGRS